VPKTLPDLPAYVSTVWFEGNGAKRHAACRCEITGPGRVRLHNLETGTIQADVSTALFRTLIARGLIRPLDEIPTRLSNKRIAIEP
jgi:hypothetical protein